MTARLLAVAAALALLAGACGGASGDSAGDATAEQDEAAQGVVPGELADASEADTEIVVKASDDLKFDPATINVEAGQVVTFVVRNEGSNVHEFVLGDSAYQEKHEQEVEDMEGHDMAAMENSVTVEPGETQELTWKFTEATSLEFACHEPGHYEGGMVGTIEVG